jgi:hypothetical protein
VPSVGRKVAQAQDSVGYLTTLYQFYNFSVEWDERMNACGEVESTVEEVVVEYSKPLTTHSTVGMIKTAKYK